MDDNAAQQLRSIIERIEGRHAEKKATDNDIRDIYAEAKGVGFDVKVIKAIIADRRKDPKVLTEIEMVKATYERALEEAGLADPVAALAA